MNKKVKVIIIISLIIIFTISGYFFGRINYLIEHDVGNEMGDYASWVLLRGNETVDVKNETFTTELNIYHPIMFSNLNPNKTYFLSYVMIIGRGYGQEEQMVLELKYIFTNRTEYELGFALNKAQIILNQIENSTFQTDFFTFDPLIFILFFEQSRWEIEVAEIFYDLDFSIYIGGILTSLISGLLYKEIKRYIVKRRNKGEFETKYPQLKE